MYNNVVRFTFIVKCSLDGLPEGQGRNCFCVWSFWCSELCIVDQTATAQRGSVLDVRGPEGFCQPFCSSWMSTVLWEWGGLYQWFARQSGLPSVVSLLMVRFGSWAEPDSYWRAEDGFNDGRVELFQQLLRQVEHSQNWAAGLTDQNIMPWGESVTENSSFYTIRCAKMWRGLYRSNPLFMCHLPLYISIRIQLNSVVQISK